MSDLAFDLNVRGTREPGGLSGKLESDVGTTRIFPLLKLNQLDSARESGKVKMVVDTILVVIKRNDELSSITLKPSFYCIWQGQQKLFDSR